MTADRLDLDALEATARKAKEQQYRPVVDAGVVLDLIAAAREAERLTRWQSEAMTVLDEWRAAWNVAGKPGRLGTSMASGMRAHVESLTAERDAAQVALARVEALHVESWECGNLSHTNPAVGCPECDVVCRLCGDSYPCVTIRAVAGEGQEAGD